MNYGRAFTYVTEDPEWLKKVGIAALVLLIPVVGGIILLGWGQEITRRVINDDPTPLPDWSNFGDLLIKGLKVFVVILIYILPILVIYGCGAGSAIGLAAIAGKSSDNAGAIGGAISLLTFCMYCIAILYGLLVGL